MENISKSIYLGRRVIIVSISIVTIVIIIYSLLSGGYKAFLQLDPVVLTLAIGTYLLSWLITGVRLMFLHKKLDVKKLLPLHYYLYARLLGGLMAYLTPSAIGGEPARAYYLYRKLNDNYTKYLALVIYEVFYDVVVISIIAIGFALYALPYTLPVILVGLANLTMWIILYSMFNNIVNPSNAHPIIAKILIFVENKIIKRKEVLENEYSNFGVYFREISSNVNLYSKLIIIFLTILSNLVTSLSIFIIGLQYTREHFLKLFIDSLMAFYYSLTLGALPTPGGAVAIEYGLSITLDPVIVVISRMIMYYTVILSGSLVLLNMEIVNKNK